MALERFLRLLSDWRFLHRGPAPSHVHSGEEDVEGTVRAGVPKSLAAAESTDLSSTSEPKERKWCWQIKQEMALLA